MRVSHRKLLWTRSAGLCAFPGCRIKPSLDATPKDAATTIGEEAHIFAHSVYGPRPNPDGVTETSNDYENRILLCPTHHRVVDKQPNTYTATDLYNWKVNLEQWVSSRLQVEEFGYAELEIIVSSLANDDPSPPSDDFRPPSIRDKIERNTLSRSIQTLIEMSIPRVHEVKGYMNHLSKFDSRYPEQLLNPLQVRFNELRNNGHDGNLVFDYLRQFAAGNSSEFRIQAAALAVIVYFFHTCDLFDQ